MTIAIVAATAGLQAAKARGVVLGRKEGQRPSDKKAKRVLSLHEEGLSYRLIARNVGLSKNTVTEIVRRQAAVAWAALFKATAVRAT
jgi:putative DNA-invertase from lambdoid prophage Rac